MIGSVKVVETAVVSEPMNVPIAIPVDSEGPPGTAN